MTDAQQQILTKVVRQLGLTVLHLSDEIGESFLIGTAMLPEDSKAQILVFRGFNASKLFLEMRRESPAEQIGAEIDKLSDQVGSYLTKFPINSTWRLYSA